MTRTALALALVAGIAATVLGASGTDGRLTGDGPAGVAGQDDAAIARLLQRVEQVVRAGDPAAYLALLSDSADRQRATEFAASEIRAGASRVALKERSRTPAAEAPPETAYRLLLDVFIEFGGHARIATWRLDVRRNDTGWAITGQGRLSAVDNLYRLVLNSTKQFAAHDFTVRAEDLDLTLVDGSVFTVDTDQGVTAVVLLGRGIMRFHPAPPIEKGQVKLFAGAETLETPFETAFVRVGELASHTDLSQLTVRPVDPKDLRKAEEVFREESPKTFTIDMGDLATGNWTTMPGATDVVAEIRTRRFGTLTYSRSSESDEDISLFDRVKQKNISVYTSAERLAERGPFIDEDAQVSYDVLDYDIDLSFAPDQRWFDSRARMRLKIRAASARQLTLRLADTLAVESVTSDEFGALFSVRVRGQNTLVVNLPVSLEKDEQITLTIEYSGRVPGQPGEWETLPLTQREVELLQGPGGGGGPQAPRPDPIYIYGSRSYWYPRSPVSDYATATLRIWVPAEFECIASGQQTPESPTLDDINPVRRRKLFVFNAARPLRYLSFLVTHLVPVERATVALNDEESGRFQGPAMGGAVYNTLDLTVLAHQRIAAKANNLATDAADIAQFYRSIIGDTPYSGLTLALVEGNTAAGHSPGYVAMIRRQSESAPRSGRSDPAAVDAYPEFQLAHQIAHQWWGQAVGWKTYHDQWLSEAFAQYFAALYVGHHRGDEAFATVMRQMRNWGIEESPQGPLFLGYRLGHVRDDDRVFRALIYNKGAAVLHMLRRLIGDDAFYLAVRRFYANWRFEKAGTDDLRLAMESESGRSLERFFERWVFGSSLPQLKFSYRLAGGEGREIVLRIDQTGDLFDVPVAVLLQYADRPPAQVILAVSDRTTEVRVPLTGTFRRAEISRDDGTLAEVQKN